MIPTYSLDSIMPIGEHAGKSIRDLYASNRRYLGWCLRTGLFNINSDIVKANCLAAYNNRTNEIIKNNQTNTMEEIPVSAFFVAIGHNPNSGIFKDYLKMDETGYILTEPGTTKTNIEGVFAAGDVQDKNYRQAVTAAGSGCMAALDAERFLTAKGH